MRHWQFARVMKSIAKSRHTNFEVVVVDDMSPEPLQKFITDIPLTHLRLDNKTWKSPDVASNKGLYYALLRKPDVIIIQNAECCHVGDVITYAAEYVTESDYISFGCFSLDKQNTFNPHDLPKVLMENERGASFDGDLAWYNHPRYRPVGYEFCAAISAENIVKLNGYDERMCEGWGYSDNLLLHRIRKMGLNVKITEPPDPFVLHLWHYDVPVPPDKNNLIRHNELMYNRLKTEESIKAQHLYTEELKRH